MNPFFEIRVNDNPITLLEPCTAVKSLIVTKLPGTIIPVQHSQYKAIAEWLYNLTQQVEYTEYNGVLIQKADINKPAHMP